VKIVNPFKQKMQTDGLHFSSSKKIAIRQSHSNMGTCFPAHGPTPTHLMETTE
jgi:hypothetical protein